MGDHLEVWRDGAPEIVPLTGAKVNIGRADGNDIVLDDRDVSRLHASAENVGAGWVLTDLGSRNGTFVNGERVMGAVAIRSDDEIRLGGYRVVFRSDLVDATTTADARPLPRLTPREHEVLVALCRPVLEGHAFSTPTTVREMAAELYVSVGAVKQHLNSLYRKFGIGGGRDRRVELANAAIRSGAVSTAHLRRSAP